MIIFSFAIIRVFLILALFLLGSIFSKMLSRNGINNLCFVSKLRGRVFSISLLNKC